MLFLWTFYSSKNPEKSIKFSIDNKFNIDKKKSLLLIEYQ